MHQLATVAKKSQKSINKTSVLNLVKQWIHWNCPEHCWTSKTAICCLKQARPQRDMPVHKKGIPCAKIQQRLPKANARCAMHKQTRILVVKTTQTYHRADRPIGRFDVLALRYRRNRNLRPSAAYTGSRLVTMEDPGQRTEWIESRPRGNRRKVRMRPSST